MSTTTRCGCLTGAEAAAIWVCFPSTRAFGRVPLTGEVDLTNRDGSVLLWPRKMIPTSSSLTSSPAVTSTRSSQQKESARRLGEVQLEERLLCVRHAKLLRLKNRSETMIGVVFEMDQWLESVDGQADELRVRRVEHQRNGVVEQLRFDRTQIGLIRHDLLKDHFGAT